MNTLNQLRMSTLLTGSLLIWGVCCFLVHGSAILAYAAIQLATSGVFALAIYRTEQKYHRTPAVGTPRSESADQTPAD